MNLEKSNQWFSLIANVGVLAGIVFLAFELQQNTNLARASAFQELTQEVAEIRSWLVTNDDLHRINQFYQDGNSAELDDESISKIGIIVRAWFGTYENAFHFYTLGIISESEWKRFENGMCGHLELVRKDQRLNFIPSTDEFRVHMETAC